MDQWSTVVERVSADPDLAAKLTSAATVDERREALRDAGIEITDEMREQAQALSRKLNVDVDDPDSWHAVELSDDELGELAGGGGGGVSVLPAATGGLFSAVASAFVTAMAAG